MPKRAAAEPSRPLRVPADVWELAEKKRSESPEKPALRPSVQAIMVDTLRRALARGRSRNAGTESA